MNLQELIAASKKYVDAAESTFSIISTSIGIVDRDENFSLHTVIGYTIVEMVLPILTEKGYSHKGRGFNGTNYGVEFANGNNSVWFCNKIGKTRYNQGVVSIKISDHRGRIYVDIDVNKTYGEGLRYMLSQIL